MHPDEIIQLLNMLSPAEQDEIMEDLGITDADLYAAQGGGPGQVSGFDFGGGMPEFSPMSQQVQALGTADYPQFTAKGALDPFDLTQATQRYSLLGNQATRMVDPSALLMAGGDLGMYDVGAFDPKVTMPTERLRSPGAEFLSSLAVGGANTYEGYLAEMMLKNRLTPAAAVNQMMSDIRDAQLPDAPPEVAARGQALIDSLKAGGFDLETQAKAKGFPSPPSGEDGQQFDVGGLTQLAAGWYKDLQSDPLAGEGWEDPTTGVRYAQAPEVEPSAQAQWFESRGIPLPTAQYTDPEYMSQIIAAAAPTYPQEEAAYQKNLTETRGQARQASQSNRNAAFDEDMMREAIAAGLPTQQAGGAGRAPAATGRGGYDSLVGGAARSLLEGDMGTVPLTMDWTGLISEDTTRSPNLNAPTIGRGPDISASLGPAMTRGQGQGMNVPWLKGDQVVSGIPGEPGFNFGQFAGMPGQLRQMQASDLGPAKQRRQEATSQAQGAITDAYKAGQQTSPGRAAALEAQARATESAAWGRTPTRDAVMKRLMGLRMLTGT